MNIDEIINLKEPKIKNYMPQDEASRKILQDRANKLAVVHEEEKIIATVSYIRFMVGNNLYYGIPFHYAKEVLHHVSLTALPFMPKYIAGIINYRGAITAVIDLSELFNLPSKNDLPNNYLIIVNKDSTTIGLLTSFVEGSAEYQENSLSPANAFGNSIKTDYILGIDKGNVTILNIEKLIQDINHQLEK